MGYAALAEVMTGWTGSIAVTVGASTVTVTPRLRDSVASIFARLIQQVYAELGLVLSLSLTSSDQFIISAPVPFDMTTSGTAATRTDFSDLIYSGASEYLSVSDGYVGRTVPVYGLRLDDPMVASKGRVVADGSSAAVLDQLGGSSSLTLFTTIQQAATIEAAIAAWTQGQQVQDVWHDGRLLGRVRFDGAPSRRPITRTHGLSSSGVEIVCQVTGVRE